MLTLPEHKRWLKLITGDPGLNNTGIAVWQIDLVERRIVSVHADTLVAQKLVDDSPFDDEVHEERLMKRYRLAQAWRRILIAEQPDDVVFESPFFDRRKPGSFAILNEVMTTLLDTLHDVNPQLKMKLIPPQKVKQELGVAGQKGKEVVREAMAKREDVIPCLTPPLDALSEHAIDAVAVGLAYLYRYATFFKHTDE